MEAHTPTDGDCKGPNSVYVKLISSDGRVFYALREEACCSSFIKSILICPADEDEINEITLDQVPGHLLELVCKYFDYRQCYKNADESEIPEFEVPIEEVMDLMIVADLIDC